MTQYIGCDTHLKYSVFRIMDENGRLGPSIRVEHAGGELDRFLATLPPGSPVAVETTGNWMWVVDRIERAGLEPHLADARQTKKRTAGNNKSDHIDCGGLAMLLRNGTLPEVWIAPAAERDLRGLVRGRLAIRRAQARFKCRIHAALNQYGLKLWVEDEDDIEVADWFSVKAHAHLMKAIEGLPPATREAIRQQYLMVEELERRVRALEQAIAARIGRLGWLRLLRTMPGVGPILAATIWLEIGTVQRFPNATHLASYAGLVPRTHSSGGKCWRGSTSRSCNHYLKWAYAEAANVIVGHRRKMEPKHPHVVHLFERVKATTKLSGKAKIAVARHLAESSWWILTKKQPYCEPTSAHVTSSATGSAR
jgi:transposase